MHTFVTLAQFNPQMPSDVFPIIMGLVAVICLAAAVWFQAKGKRRSRNSSLILGAFMVFKALTDHPQNLAPDVSNNGLKELESKNQELIHKWNQKTFGSNP